MVGRLSVQAAIYTLHLWIGLIFLILMVPIGLSGSLLVWHDGLDGLLNPERRVARDHSVARPLQDYLTAAAAAAGGPAASLRLPGQPGEAVVVNLTLPGQPRPGQGTVWLDPASGTVLDIANRQTSLVGILHSLHGSLMVPQFSGRQIVGWVGVALLMSSLTAVWLWWPRDFRLLRALAWPRVGHTPYRLHRLFGIWIAIPMAVLSATGVWISFPQTVRLLRGQEGLVQAQQRPAPPLPHPMLSADAALAAAQAQIADARLRQVTLPTQAQPAWRLQFAAAAGAPPMTIEVDDASGAARPWHSAGAADPLNRLMRQIHDGGGTGLVWQSIVFVSGLLPLLLAVTGVMIWLRRRRMKRRMQPVTVGA